MTPVFEDAKLAEGLRLLAWRRERHAGSGVVAFATIGLSCLIASCERKPPAPRPLAEAAEVAEASGLPFSASCQSWTASDLEPLSRPDGDASPGHRRLDAIWRALVKHHLDPTLACLDWPRVRARQLEELGADPTTARVDESFANVFAQLGNEAPRILKSRGADADKVARPPGSALPGHAKLVAYAQDASVIEATSTSPGSTAKGKSPGKKGAAGPPTIPPGMELSWWTLGSWTVRAVKQIEGARSRAAKAGRSLADKRVIDLRETDGTSVRTVLRLLGHCAESDRVLGELTDRKGKRELKVKVKAKSDSADASRLIVMTSPRSSTRSQLFAFTAVNECGARWWYESKDLEPKSFPEKASRPVWFESDHRLPGGGELRVRGGFLDLHPKRAGPAPRAELRRPADMEIGPVLEFFAEGRTGGGAGE
jgi:hypothetical protein